MPGGIPALVGSTGSGKSQLAESLALADPRWQLINADPFQAYRGLDIGTAKPAAERRKLYALMDVAEPTEALDAVSYAQRIGHEISLVLQAGRWPLLVGGSGFYLDALEHPHDPEPQVSQDVLLQLRARIAADAQDVLRQIHQHNPALRLPPPGDHYRIEKAWIRAFGSVTHAPARPPAIALRYYGLWAEGNTYEAMLHARLQRMLAQGWADEARRLSAQCGTDAPALRAIGYQQLAESTGPVNPALQQQILTATRQYAKRQRTWFRARAVRWFPAAIPGSSPQASMTLKGAQNLILRLLQYTDVCNTESR